MKSHSEKLPHGWIAGCLADYVHPRNGRVSPQECPDLPFIGMENVESQSTRIRGSVPASQMKSSAARFLAHDVIYGRLRPYLNKVAQPKFDGLASAEFIVFPCDAIISPLFLKHRLNAADFVSFASHLNEGDRPRVSFDQIGAFPILLPPAREQERIAAKIEELFSELDKGVENLEIAHAQLGTYRLALLTAAFQGKLTASWREGRSEVRESAQAIRARLESVRRQQHDQDLERWRQEIAKWKRGGQRGRKPAKPRATKSLRNLSGTEAEILPALPEGWLWERLGWMTCGVEYGTAAKSASIGKVAVLRMGNIQNAKLDWSDLVFTSDEEQIASYWLQSGDVLFNRTNSPELVGKTAIYRGEQPAIFAGYLIRVNHIPRVVDSQYLNLFLNSHIARVHGNHVKTDGVNQSNINGDKLVNFPFPYCSLDEQKEIVRILDEKLSLIDDMAANIASELRRAQALRQTILARAFAGRLVPQNPSDEPASTLLDRIREDSAPKQASERAATSRNGKKRKTAA